MTEPLTPANADLRDFPFTPLFRARLFGSSFHANADDSEWRAGVTLWLKSWDQVPAGSLPTGDVELCRLAELGRDVKTWRKVKEGALRGWIECSDGRLYHPVVAEGINEAIARKNAQRAKTLKARIAALEKHLSHASSDSDKERLTDEIRQLQQTLSQTVRESVTDPSTESKREGQGQGEGFNSEAKASGAGAPLELVDKSGVNGVDVIFAYGLPLLTAAGVSERNARSMLGLMRKQHGDAAVTRAIERCGEQQAVEPVGFLQGALKAIVKGGPLSDKESGPPWWSSHAGIDKKARELGMQARGNESYDDFKVRLFDRIRETKAVA